MNIKPIRGQVIVKPDPSPEVSKLIVMPDIAKSDNPNYYPETGVIMALAEHSYSEDGEEDVPFDVKVGDRIHFGRYAGKYVKCSDDGVEYLVMFEKEIVAVIDDEQILHGYEAPATSEITSHDRDPFEHLM